MIYAVGFKTHQFFELLHHYGPGVKWFISGNNFPDATILRPNDIIHVFDKDDSSSPICFKLKIISSIYLVDDNKFEIDFFILESILYLDFADL